MPYLCFEEEVNLGFDLGGGREGHLPGRMARFADWSQTVLKIKLEHAAARGEGHLRWAPVDPTTSGDGGVHVGLAEEEGDTAGDGQVGSGSGRNPTYPQRAAGGGGRGQRGPAEGVREGIIAPVKEFVGLLGGQDAEGLGEPAREDGWSGERGGGEEKVARGGRAEGPCAIRLRDDGVRILGPKAPERAGRENDGLKEEEACEGARGEDLGVQGDGSAQAVAETETLSQPLTINDKGKHIDGHLRVREMRVGGVIVGPVPAEVDGQAMKIRSNSLCHR